MIKVENLSKRLGKFELKDVSFEIPSGYIIGLIGQNGAGKTTLLHVLLGLYNAKDGRVEINGMKYDKDEKAIREDVGVVLQEKLYNDSFKLMDIANYHGKYYKNYDRESFLAYAERFEINPKTKYGKLSKGEELKFQLAFALSHRPKLLILDEPTANFDRDFRKEFWKVMKEFVEDEEHTVLIATHLVDDLDRVADYLLYLHNGELIFRNDIEFLRSRYRIAVGDKYRIKILPEKDVIETVDGDLQTKALIFYREDESYKGLEIYPPTIEEFMYMISVDKADCM